MNLKDWQILLVCMLLIALGFIMCSSRDLFVGINITDWFTSIGTVGAVVVAMWTVNENHKQDTYKIQSKVSISTNKTDMVFPDATDGFYNDKETIIKLRVSNTGKRPITLECLIIKNTDKNPIKVDFNIIEVGRSDRWPILEPGAFFTKNIHYCDTDLNLEEASNADYLIVDANEKTHKAYVQIN